MADFTLRHDGLKWQYEVPTDDGVVEGWRPTAGWARRAARRHVRPPTVPCPTCGEGIDRLARRCQFCGIEVPDVGSPEPVDPMIPKAAWDAAPRPRVAVAGARPAPPTSPRSTPWSHLPPPPRAPKPAASAKPGEVAPLTPAMRVALLGAAAAAAVAIVALVGYAVLHADSRSVRASNAPTTTGAPLPSAAGKPCVAVAVPLPADAPEVAGLVGPAPTAVEIKDIKEGDGAAVEADDTVTINFVAVACSTGTVIASSYDTGAPLTVPVRGLEAEVGDAMVGMKVGGQRLIGLPGGEADGAAPPDVMAPDDAVWYAVELTATSH